MVFFLELRKRESNREREWFLRRWQEYGNYVDPRVSTLSKKPDDRNIQNALADSKHFFFTNFPDDFGVKEMRSMFNK